MGVLRTNVSGGGRILELENELEIVKADLSESVMQSIYQSAVGGSQLATLFPDHFISDTVKSGNYTYNCNKCIKRLTLSYGCGSSDTTYPLSLEDWVDGTYSTRVSLQKNQSIGYLNFYVGHQYFFSTASWARLYVQKKV